MIQRRDGRRRRRIYAGAAGAGAGYTAARMASDWRRAGYPGARTAYKVAKGFFDSNARTGGNTKYMLPGAAKYFDTNGEAHTVQLTREIANFEEAAGNGGFGVDWLKIPDDANASSRSGNHIWITSIYIKLDLVFRPEHSTDANQTFQNCKVTLYLVEDNQCNGSHAGATDVWDDNDLGFNIANLENAERFNILGKKSIALRDIASSTGIAVISHATKDIYFNLGKTGKEIVYKGSTGGIGERTRRNLCLFAAVDNQFTNGIANVCSMRYKIRVRFRG